MYLCIDVSFSYFCQVNITQKPDMFILKNRNFTINFIYQQTFGKLSCGEIPRVFLCKWQPTPILLPRKCYGWRSLVGYSPWGLKESDTSETTEHTRCINTQWTITQPQKKKETNTAISSNMDGPRDNHTKWSKSEKDKYHMVSPTCGIFKDDTHELIYKTETGPQT